MRQKAFKRVSLVYSDGGMCLQCSTGSLTAFLLGTVANTYAIPLLDSMKREETKAIILFIFMFLDVEAIISMLFMAVEHNFNAFYKRYQKSIHYSLFSLPKRFYIYLM